METSTPLCRIALRNVMEVSPLRRSLSQTPIVALEDVNDERERSSRRSLIDMQRRLSNIQGTSLNESYKFSGEEDVKEHYLICKKLFTENVSWRKRTINLI